MDPIIKPKEARMLDVQRYPRFLSEEDEQREQDDRADTNLGIRPPVWVQFAFFNLQFEIDIPISVHSRSFAAKHFALARPPDRRRAFTADTIKAARVQKRRPQRMAGDNGIQPRAARSHHRNLTIESMAFGGVAASFEGAIIAAHLRIGAA